MQKEELFCLFSLSPVACFTPSPSECYFVAKEEKEVWGVAKAGQLFFPSALLCIEKGQRSQRLYTVLKKKVVYQVVSRPGITLVRPGCDCDRRRAF